jgi:hypothetical protein
LSGGAGALSCFGDRIAAHDAAAELMQFDWQWFGGRVCQNLDVIWEMSI